ncbi:MAG: hypothetical protein KBT27_02710 [Prevotellaceae bacterium]|nr:hypothetical protein [Candidatus Faecinaster equi]
MSSRLLGAYVAMRLDDYTLLAEYYCKNKKKDVEYSQELKKKFNSKLRAVRDKIGAHFQQTTDIHIDRVSIFRSYNHGDICSIIEDAKLLYEIVTGLEQPVVLLSTHDLNLVRNELGRFYQDDVAHIGVDSLAIGGKNVGGIIMCSKPQRKAQDLKSIQILEEIAHSLYLLPYDSIEIKRLFKRLWICTVVNYCDNLLTRDDIREDSAQYEEGFDQLFRSLLNAENETILSSFFSDLYSQYPKLKSNIRYIRKVREHACAHLERSMSIEQIHAELDMLDDNMVECCYTTLLQAFDYIVGHVFLLQPLVLAPRTPVYNATFEKIYSHDFYNREESNPCPAPLTQDAMFEMIRKHTPMEEIAKVQLKDAIMGTDENMELMQVLVDRLVSKGLTLDEMQTWVCFLHSCRTMYPDRIVRMCRCVISARISSMVYGAMLWLLSEMHYDRKQFDFVERIINRCLRNGSSYVEKVYGLKMCIEKDVCSEGLFCFEKDIPITDEFRTYINQIHDRKMKLCVLVAVCSCWFHSPVFCHYASKKETYSRYLVKELKNALVDYEKYSKMMDDVCAIMDQLVEMHRFNQLGYHLVATERIRKQEKNVFLDLLRYPSMYQNYADWVEYLYVGLIYEEMGELECAHSCLLEVVSRETFNEDAIRIFDEFIGRHPEFRDESSLSEQQKRYLR